MEPNIHVSPAISHLRFHVAVMSVIVILTLIIQLLVFGFVHFTDARWQSASQPAQTQSLSVVSTAAPTEMPETPEGGETSEDPKNQSIQRKSTTLEEIEAQRNAMQLSRWHFVMGQFSSLAVTAGVVAAITLALLTVLGVVIAGGAAVPGIEKAVTACTWAMVLALVALPWNDAFASMPFGGAFGGYERMIASSEAISLEQESSLSLYATHLLMPLAAIGVALLVAARFWAGVSRGVILKSVSQLDDAVDREISGIQSRGVASNIGPRAIGVMNEAAGASVHAPAARPAPANAPAEHAPPAEPLPQGRLI